MNKAGALPVCMYGRHSRIWQSHEAIVGGCDCGRAGAQVRRTAFGQHRGAFVSAKCRGPLRRLNVQLSRKPASARTGENHHPLSPAHRRKAMRLHHDHYGHARQALKPSGEWPAHPLQLAPHLFVNCQELRGTHLISMFWANKGQKHTTHYTSLLSFFRKFLQARAPEESQKGSKGSWLQSLNCYFTEALKAIKAQCMEKGVGSGRKECEGKMGL